MEDFDKLLARIKAYRRGGDGIKMNCESENDQQKVSLEDIFKGIAETLEKEIDSCQDKKEETVLKDNESENSCGSLFFIKSKSNKEKIECHPKCKVYILVDDKTKIYHVIMNEELLPNILEAYTSAFPDLKFKWEAINRWHEGGFGRNANALEGYTSGNSFRFAFNFKARTKND